MRHPILTLAAAGVAGLVLWKVVFPFFLPFLLTLFKIALVVGLVLFVMWWFNNRKSKDSEKPAE